MEHVNVLVVGAGVSGIGAACHLKRKCPDHTFVVLEGRESLGGTWDLFRYPGIRSDSDMYTFGYSFKPWAEERDIATAESILRYLRATVDEYDLDEAIHYRRRVERVSWSSEERRWLVEITRTEDGSTYHLTCDFLLTGTGYYDYERGYEPELPGLADFEGEVVHPQRWPEDLDYAGKRVLVIGSGATAVTLVPAMAPTAAHVTMLQRSPTYMYVRPWADEVAMVLRRLLPAPVAHRLTRAKNIALLRGVFALVRRSPAFGRRMMRRMAEEALGEDFDIDRHFSPDYDPWDQRVCLIPDGDFYRVLREGRATVVTDTIERFDAKGVRLTSGGRVDADVVVTATGLVLKFLSNIAMDVDGRSIAPGELITYNGAMFAGVPNWVAVFGYTSASWTLKADLISVYLCRILRHMRAHGYDTVVPRLDGPASELRPLMDNLQSGYVKRGAAAMPKQLDRAPWVSTDEYLRDFFLFRFQPLEGGALRFSKGAPRARVPLEASSVRA